MKKDALSSALDSQCLVLQNVSGGMNMKNLPVFFFVAGLVILLLLVSEAVPVVGILMDGGTVSRFEIYRLAFFGVCLLCVVVAAVPAWLRRRRGSKCKETVPSHPALGPRDYLPEIVVAFVVFCVVGTLVRILAARAVMSLALSGSVQNPEALLLVMYTVPTISGILACVVVHLLFRRHRRRKEEDR